MLTPEQLAEAYGRNVQIIKLQAEGVSHAESLVQLHFRANCLNWLVGHLITNRNNVLMLLGTPPACDRDHVARYARESDPITADEAGVLPLEELIGILEQSQEQLASLLATITPEALSQPTAFFGRRSMPVAEWLFFFYFHDTYHTGQSEILRQAAGKNDKVI